MSTFGRLVRTELGRLRSRRLSVLVAVALVVVVGLYGVALVLQVRPPTASETQQVYRGAHDAWAASHAQNVSDCVTSGETREDCESYDPEPRLADYVVTPPSFDGVGEGALLLGAFLAMLAGYLVAASFIGAELGTGSLANWLTFVPRRLHVLGSKLVAVVLGSALAGACTVFTAVGLAALVTHAYGLPVTGAGTLAQSAGRGVALAALAGVLGFAVALLTRHTVAAIGVALGYAVVGTVLRGLSSDADGRFAGLPPWLPENNVLAFLQHGYDYEQYSRLAADGAVERHLGFGHSAVYWLVLLLVAVVASAVVFRRRDVT